MAYFNVSTVVSMNAFRYSAGDRVSAEKKINIQTINKPSLPFTACGIHVKILTTSVPKKTAFVSS